ITSISGPRCSGDLLTPPPPASPLQSSLVQSAFFGQDAKAVVPLMPFVFGYGWLHQQSKPQTTPSINPPNIAPQHTFPTSATPHAFGPDSVHVDKCQRHPLGAHCNGLTSPRLREAVR